MTYMSKTVGAILPSGLRVMLGEVSVHMLSLSPLTKLWKSNVCLHHCTSKLSVTLDVAPSLPDVLTCYMIIINIIECFSETGPF